MHWQIQAKAKVGFLGCGDSSKCLAGHFCQGRRLNQGERRSQGATQIGFNFNGRIFCHIGNPGFGLLHLDIWKTSNPAGADVFNLQRGLVKQQIATQSCQCRPGQAAGGLQHCRYISQLPVTYFGRDFKYSTFRSGIEGNRMDWPLN